MKQTVSKAGKKSMKQSTIIHNTHPDQRFNTTHGIAWNLGTRITSFNFWNVFFRFWPPKLVSVAIVPPKGTAIHDDPFESAMFKRGGFLENTPLNHYWRLNYKGKDLFLNAGAILQHFALGNYYGFRAVKEALDYSDSNHSGIPDKDVQEKGDGLEQRTAGVLSGQSDQGERTDH